MTITPIEHGLDLAISRAYRSPGLHMSDIYNRFYQDSEPKRFKKGVAPDPLHLEMGLSMEAVMEEGLKRRLAERPGEFTTPEGVIFSPDLLIYNHVLRVGEIKLTWMSEREVVEAWGTEPGAIKTFATVPQKFRKWFTQLMNYNHALGTPYARLYSAFVNGNYKGSGPTLRAWDIEFTQRELDEEHDMLFRYARREGML